MYKLLADQLQSPSALWVEPNTELRASRFFNQTSSLVPTLTCKCGCVIEVRFVDLAHWLRIKTQIVATSKWNKSLKRSTTKGSKPHYRQSTIMERSDSSPPHLLSPPLFCSCFQFSTKTHREQEHHNSASTTSAHEKLKLLSHLAWLRENGGSTICHGIAGASDCGGPSVHSV